MIRAQPPHSPLASFYERHLALREGSVLEWIEGQPPRRIALDAVHVAVAQDTAYAVDRSGRLLAWTAADAVPQPLLDGVAYASAGVSGVLAITTDGRLHQRRTDAPVWLPVADAVHQAWVGDSSDYYVTRAGTLFVSGLAHRGQYGDGLLTAVEGWKAVAEAVVHVCAHTGHAILLKEDGTVEGTGGNRFGPLGTHGFGDKADRWGTVFRDAAKTATGARHTAALKTDGSLWLWGEHAGLVPRQLLDGISAVACGDRHTLALAADGRLWFWATGNPPALLRP
ncbi:MAG: RCC1 domain-containing protein [Burkholderiales bacterium]